MTSFGWVIFGKINDATSIKLTSLFLSTVSLESVHQHIFWGKDGSSSVKEYQLNTVTYDMMPSAFLAQQAIQQLVDDEGAPFPLALLENT